MLRVNTENDGLVQAGEPFQELYHLKALLRRDVVLHEKEAQGIEYDDVACEKAVGVEQLIQEIGPELRVAEEREHRDKEHLLLKHVILDVIIQACHLFDESCRI